MPGREPLNSEKIELALAELSGWAWESDTIRKRFQFSSFKEAISFLVRVSFEAESLDHHPELTNVYNRVDVVLTTHNAGNRVTETDFELARAIEHFSWT
ncbi:MAG: 4a-hydroxytetrahydrobiopterin dehydratase [Rhodothermia bacterium]|nr:MAG: 4a-hydroxytetrahydrobiopterin dehydratase [Rhodothermia bacterium]